MARQIVVERGGTTSAFDFAKVDRSKLYGRRRRVPLDPTGEPCTRASLSEDGTVLVRSGMTAQGYYTDEGHWVPNGELVSLDEAGQPKEPVKTTLGEPQALDGPFGPERVLDLVPHALYALTPADVDEALVASLRAGEVYELPFAYRTGYIEDTALLVAGEQGELFALVGRIVEPIWREAEERIPSVLEDDGDDDGDLDFEMF
ncbi:MAG: hypothetical protein AAF447_09060 [Myxococcota bacterium]